MGALGVTRTCRIRGDPSRYVPYIVIACFAKRCRASIHENRRWPTDVCDPRFALEGCGRQESMPRTVTRHGLRR